MAIRNIILTGNPIIISPLCIMLNGKNHRENKQDIRLNHLVSLLPQSFNINGNSPMANAILREKVKNTQTIIWCPQSPLEVNLFERLDLIRYDGEKVLMYKDEITKETFGRYSTRDFRLRETTTLEDITYHLQL